MSVRITIDSGVCIGSGQCTLTAPAVFDQDDDGYGTVRPARALLPGLVVGDTSRIPADLDDAFRATDLTH
ncbi:ferredoxin, partial [Streptomyces sp. NPDC002536]